MNKEKVIIIGAGPAGLAAAYQLLKLGYPVVIFEAGSKPGGLSQSIRMWNQTVDLGPHHFVNSYPAVNKLWTAMIGDDEVILYRQSRIFYQGKFFNYPLRFFDIMWNLHGLESLRCLVSFFYQRWFPIRPDGSFEAFIIKRFGRRLYEIFFKNYTENLWGISCDKLDADFAIQRIRKFSLLEAILAMFQKKKIAKHKTLASEFRYPVAGAGMLYDRLHDHIIASGAEIHYEAPVQYVQIEFGQVTGVQLQSGEVYSAGQVISTMPLTTLIRNLPNVPKGIIELLDQLHFRNTILVYHLIDHDNLFDDHWLYINSSLKLGRITNFRNWSPQLYGSDNKTVLCAEYWCSDSDPIWHEAESTILKMAQQELLSLGLIRPEWLLESHAVKVSKTYPVYAKGYRNYLNPIHQYVESISGLQAIGRYGSFQYNNQDHSLMMGMMAADKIAGLRTMNQALEYH